jgi:hypothetical protein
MSLPLAAALPAAAASLARGARAPTTAASGQAASRGVSAAARPAGRGSAARASAGSVSTAASSTGEVSFAIVGDLHLDPKEMELFYEARTQLRAALSDSTVRGGPAASATAARAAARGAPGACLARLSALHGRSAGAGGRLAPCTRAARSLARCQVPSLTLSLAPRCAQGAPLPDARLVQLGDLGAYAAKPGSKACFALASDFFRRVRASGRATLGLARLTRAHALRRCAAASRRCRSAS